MILPVDVPARCCGVVCPSVLTFFAVIGWILSGSEAWAQGAAASPAGRVPQMAIQQLDTIKARQQTQAAASQPTAEEESVPQLYPGESQDLGSQKLLRQKPKKKYFEAAFDTQFSYSSNALLAENGPQDSGIWATTLSLAFAPEPLELGPGKLAYRTGYRHLLWMYDVKNANTSSTLNNLNFMFETVYLSGRYSFLENWGATLGLDYNRVLTGKNGGNWQWSRVTEPDYWKEAYVELVPNWGLDRSFTFSPRWSGSLAYSGLWHFSSSDPQGRPGFTNRRSNDRIDNAMMASVMFMPTEQIMFQPFARVMYSAYTRSGGVDSLAGNYSHRRDWVQSFGLNVMWMPTPAVAVRATASGEFRDSSDPLTPDYSKFDTSLGMSINLRF